MIFILHFNTKRSFLIYNLRLPISSELWRISVCLCVLVSAWFYYNPFNPLWGFSSSTEQEDISLKTIVRLKDWATESEAQWQDRGRDQSCTSSLVSTVTPFSLPSSMGQAQGEDLRMTGFLLVLLVDWKWAEPQMLLVIVLSGTERQSASVAGWGFWVGRGEVGWPE